MVIGLSLPDSLQEAADRLGVRWPESDEAEFDRCGTRFARTGAEFEMSRTVVRLHGQIVQATNLSQGLSAFQKHSDRLSAPLGTGQESHMAASAVTATAIAAAYEGASATVAVLKVAVMAHLVNAAVAFEVEKTFLGLGGPSRFPAVFAWVKWVAQEACKGVEQAFAHAVKQLDEVLAEAEKRASRAETATLRLRARLLTRDWPGSTSAARHVPPGERSRADQTTTTSSRPTDVEVSRRWADGNPTAADKHGVQEFGRQVPYGGTELAQAVINERRERGGKRGVNNYAAVRLRNGEQIVMRSGLGDEGHSEQRIVAELERRRQRVRDDSALDPEVRRARLDDLEVEELYTERQPCADTCQRIVDPAKTTWTFPWEPQENRPSKQSLEKVIRERS